MLDALPGASEAASGIKDAMKECVTEFNRKHAGAEHALGAPESTSSGPQQDEAARTMCKPQFSDSDRPVNVHATQLPTESLDLPQFESKKESFGASLFVKFL